MTSRVGGSVLRAARGPPWLTVQPRAERHVNGRSRAAGLPGHKRVNTDTIVADGLSSVTASSATPSAGSSAAGPADCPSTAPPWTDRARWPMGDRDDHGVGAARVRIADIVEGNALLTSTDHRQPPYRKQGVI